MSYTDFFLERKLNMSETDVFPFLCVQAKDDVFVYFLFFFFFFFYDFETA